MAKHSTQLKLRIDWSEMDLFGHVNNVSFFKYVQAARVNYWEQVGINQLHKTENIGPTLASVSCQFKKPLYFPGEVIINTKVEWMKNSSFRLSHQLHNATGELVAEAEDIVVMFNYTTQQKTDIPEAIKTLIQQGESQA
ncbi:MAG: hypothetical protein K0S33_2587 [Bacteroidetes bacterium]|jgi:acyl-CoA thioester hydrolase|nr:hypothetical protein [Bacteroidota bacterium]